VNVEVIYNDIRDATVLSEFVQKQFSMDWCGIEASNIGSLQSLLAGIAISVGDPEISLSREIGNVSIECHFHGCWKAGIEATLETESEWGRFWAFSRAFRHSLRINLRMDRGSVTVHRSSH
jgi:hypothetical protein